MTKNTQTQNKTWKQPIDTGLKEKLKSDKPALTLMVLLLLDATNKEQLIPINTGRGNTFVTIQKGQVIYGRFKYQENFLLQVGQTGIIDRILKRLEKVHKLVDRQTYSHYTVVTIKNYDVLTKMDRLIDRQCTGNRQAIDTYKSVKSVKSVKTVGLPNQKTTPSRESGLKPKTRKKLWAALNKISTLEVAKQRGGNK